MLLMSCTCEPSTHGGQVDYSQWIGQYFQICMFYEAPLDIIAVVCMGIHFFSWFLLFIPQLYRNYSYRSAANISLLYLSFWLISEMCFLIATVMEQWALLWIILRSWRFGMTAVLLMQSVYYKHFHRNEFAVAVEAPFARSNNRAGEGYFEQHDYEFDGIHERKLSGWPTRKPNGNGNNNSNGTAISNKSSAYGLGGNSNAMSWGQALLSEGGGGTPPPRPSQVDQLSSSPSRSRLPSTHQHLLQEKAPRTVSPNQSPKIAHVRTLSKGGSSVVVNSSSHSVINTSSRTGSGHSSPVNAVIENEKRRVSNLTHGVKVTRATLSPSNSASGSFHTSPSSAFHPVAHQSSSHQAGSLSHIANVNDDSFPENSGGSTGGGGGGASMFTVGLSVVCITLYVMSGSFTQPTLNSVTTPTHSSPSRVLLSTEASLPVQQFPSGLVEKYASGMLRTDSSTNSTSFCNRPADPDPPTSTVIRIFSWSGCLFGSMSFFPQYIYNNDYMRSVEGLSFYMFTLMSIGNMGLVLGMALPLNNDWLSNRYHHEDSAFESWYLNQVILPVLIVHAFNWLQIWVLVVQRAKFKAPRVQHY